MISIVICALCGAIYSSWTSQQSKESSLRELNNRLVEKVPCVYAVNDVPEGDIVNAEDVEERAVLFSKMPQDALTSRNLCIGRVCHHALFAGQIVSQHDFGTNCGAYPPIRSHRKSPAVSHK